MDAIIARGMRLAKATVMAICLGIGLSCAPNALARASSQEPPPPVEVWVTAADKGREVELTGDQVLVVSLEANASTGYTWQVAEMAVGAESEPVLHQVGATEFQPESELLGAPGTEILRFEVVTEGEGVLRLAYFRPWEPGSDPARVFYLEVRTLGPSSDVETATVPQAGAPEAESTPVPGYQSQGDLPSAFNWCALGGCTPVRDQGLCGSCWAFATVGPLELNMLIKGGLVADLSEQYLVSCNTEYWGCDGGSWAHDYHAWKVPPGEIGPGAVNEPDFPYAAADIACSPPHLHHHKIDQWSYVSGDTVLPPAADMKQAIYDHGPIAAGVCVNSAFQSYTGGIFLGPECSLANHAIVLVGWDDSEGSSGVWILRNSWGPGWGEDGYMRIGYGVSRVGVGANYVEYTPSRCYDLIVTAEPASGGTVTATPPPDCGANGYEPGAVVQLTASENAGWHLSSWTGAASADSHTVSLTMDSHKAITAHFQPDITCAAGFVLPLTLAVGWIAWQRR